MFSHVSRELGAHQCIGSRASDLAGDDRDVLVIGSGLGGSVAAVQLTEKGDGVRVSAVWRKVSDKDFAETTWNIKRFACAPLGLTGTQRIYLLAKVMVHAGVGDFLNRGRRSILIKHSQRLLEIAERAVERIRAGRMTPRAR
jgi:glycine/D-amino acid oxidase-like deaminating enzyme